MAVEQQTRTQTRVAKVRVSSFEPENSSFESEKSSFESESSSFEPEKSRLPVSSRPFELCCLSVDVGHVR